MASDSAALEEAMTLVISPLAAAIFAALLCHAIRCSSSPEPWRFEGRPIWASASLSAVTPASAIVGVIGAWVIRCMAAAFAAPLLISKSLACVEAAAGEYLKPAGKSPNHLQPLPQSAQGIAQPLERLEQSTV